MLERICKQLPTSELDRAAAPRRASPAGQLIGNWP
jgi:hypothetical protein